MLPPDLQSLAAPEDLVVALNTVAEMHRQNFQGDLTVIQAILARITPSQKDATVRLAAVLSSNQDLGSMILTALQMANNAQPVPGVQQQPPAAAGPAANPPHVPGGIPATGGVVINGPSASLPSGGVAVHQVPQVPPGMPLAFPQGGNVAISAPPSGGIAGPSTSTGPAMRMGVNGGPLGAPYMSQVGHAIAAAPPVSATSLQSMQGGQLSLGRHIAQPSTLHGPSVGSASIPHSIPQMQPHSQYSVQVSAPSDVNNASASAAAAGRQLEDANGHAAPRTTARKQLNPRINTDEIVSTCVYLLLDVCTSCMHLLGLTGHFCCSCVCVYTQTPYWKAPCYVVTMIRSYQSEFNCYV